MSVKLYTFRIFEKKVRRWDNLQELKKNNAKKE